MQSISLIGGTKSELTLNRWAGSYKDTPVYKPEIEATGVKGTLFEGTAAEAIKLLPKMINIGVSTSLATVGPENTYIKITGEPNIPHNDDNVNIRVYSEHAWSLRYIKEPNFNELKCCVFFKQLSIASLFLFIFSRDVNIRKDCLKR